MFVKTIEDISEQMEGLTQNETFANSSWISPRKKRPTGEFQTLLLWKDEEQKEELKEGDEEVEELLEK